MADNDAVAAAGAGSSWRSRSATTCSVGQELNELVDDVFTAAGRLPHRPLPGQGDGPEHARAALRQHAVRAGVERQLRRLGADHDGRGRRHRQPGRLLRRGRRRPRRAAEPPAAAAGADRDGGAGQPSTPRRSAPRSSRCSGAIALPADLDALRGARPVRRRAGSAGERVVGYLDEEDVPPDSTTETYAAVRLGVETRRWAGVPFYLRTGKRLPRRVTEIAVVFKKAPHLPFARHRHRGARPQPARRPGAARRGRDAAVRLQGAGHARWRSATSRWTSCTARRSPSPRPEAYERLVLDVLHRRQHAVPAQRGGRGVLAGDRPAGGRPGPARKPEPYRAGEWGPRERRRDAGPRRAGAWTDEP